jgi:hypothetical protein
MEPAQPSSSDSLGQPGEFLRREWQQRPLNVEAHFDIVGEFKEKAPVNWVYRQFKRCNLLPLLKPTENFFYPPFVRIFYQNLNFDTDIPAYLSSTILGQRIYVGIIEIATALDCRLMTRAIDLVSTLHTVIYISSFVICLEVYMEIVKALE